MHKIHIIGKSIGHLKHILTEKGYEVSEFDSLDQAVPFAEHVDAILIDKDSKENKEYLASLKQYPKVIIGIGGTSKGFLHWLKEPHAYPLYDPTDKEVVGFLSRLIKEKTMFQTSLELESEIKILKSEIAFHEEINRMLTSSSDLNEVLVLIMKKIQEMTMAESWSILMVEEETGDLVFERAEGKVRKSLKKYRLRPGEGIAGWVALEGIPVVIEDVSKDERFTGRIDEETHYNTKSLMCMPIKSKDKVLGVLEVVNKTTGESFTNKDLSLLEKFIKQAALAMEKSSLYQKMEELVITDDLTKLFNTRYLNRTIETEVIRSNRYHTSLSLIFMDIDFFKNVNDNYGHLVGSKILVEMGQILLTQLRSIDIVARYGGDEFVIVLPQTTPNDAVRIAERIRKAVEQNVFLTREGFNLRITSSFGVASYPESAKTKEDLLRVADEAMYRVKHSTRNGVFALI